MSKPRLALTALLVVFCLSAITSLTYAGREQTNRIRLRYIKPSTFLEFLSKSTEGNSGPIPKGVTRLSPDDLNRGLMVKADPEGLARLEELVRLLDIPAASVRFQLRLLRTGDNPKSAPEVIVTASGEARNNAPQNLPIFVDGKFAEIRLTPHVNGDGTITMQSVMHFAAWDEVTPAPDGTRPPYTTTRIVKDGERNFLTVITEGKFIRPTDTPPVAPALWVEVTPTIVPASPATVR